MATTHGKETVFTLDANDLSAFTKTSDLDQDVDVHDDSGYGDDDKTFVPGQRESSFSFEGTHDNSSSGAKDVVEAIIDAGAPVTLIRQLEGVGTGLPQESVSVIVTKYRETSSVADIVKFNVDCQGSGAITRTTQA